MFVDAELERLAREYASEVFNEELPDAQPIDPTFALLLSNLSLAIEKGDDRDRLIQHCKNIGEHLKTVSDEQRAVLFSLVQAKIKTIP